MSALSDVLAWVVVVTFVAGAGLVALDRRDLGRRVSSAAWGLFGVFWLSVFPIFAFEMRSFIEGALSLFAVPACLYTGYLHYRGRDSLMVLSRAVAVMGVIYLPVETIPLVRQFLIETVAVQTHVVIQVLGYAPELTTGPEFGYQSMFVFTGPDGHRYTTFIITACTGIGSMAIFAGLISAVKAPLDRKIRALAMAIPIIWVLNIARNVFIAVAFGDQWFQQDLLVSIATGVVGYQDPALSSYFFADRVISQSLSVVALVGITWLVVHELPELLSPIEEALYVATGTEYDLQEVLGLGPGEAVRADGGVGDAED